MVEKARRRADETPRRTRERRWEVFVRESESEPMCRVGTVAAPSPEVAHEEASRLFAWYARDVWLCPADETHRFSTYSLEDDGAEDAAGTDEDADARGTSEPRVYEETEGTPDGSAPKARKDEDPR
ncbi:Htur_1727 family rSAM-partnered candidate RiPP [Halorubrum sp. F4]|uniref:Htur_1727 family rSAM-partnered candidate RiPP n=1 Tax=Halorubrum sp. F4 TaxID=2989715 RepID=UPI00247FEC03|nr:Htur_1727 family rSAM-partnered candidate RiPP [Halorubrum sp. F4]